MNDMKSIRFPPPVADDMICAILEGRKTVTRRVVKQSVVDKFVLSQDNRLLGSFDNRHPGWEIYSTIDDSFYSPGDILYVRETWNREPSRYGSFIYRADGCYGPGMPWRPSVHMPREAARLFLRVTDVRVERLQDISEEQATKEGVYRSREDYGIAIYTFFDIWDSTIKKPADRALYGWAANPWVWVIAFERCEKPERGTDDG